MAVGRVLGVVMLGVVPLLALAGCGEEQDHTAGIGERCSSDQDCVSGAFCSKGGDSIGLCTADCDTGHECDARFGGNNVCGSEGCFKICAAPSDCATRRCVDGNYPYCGSGPIQMFDLCDANTVCPAGLQCLNDNGTNVCTKHCIDASECPFFCLDGVCT